MQIDIILAVDVNHDRINNLPSLTDPAEHDDCNWRTRRLRQNRDLQADLLPGPAGPTKQ